VSVYGRILRGADGTHQHWIALEDDKCTGESFHALRRFCGERGLPLSRHGHSVNRNGRFFQVFMFADEEHAEIFRARFGGEAWTLPREEKARAGRSGGRRQMSKSLKGSIKRIKGL
jgi:hypothetical protein